MLKYRDPGPTSARGGSLCDGKSDHFYTASNVPAGFTWGLMSPEVNVTNSAHNGRLFLTGTSQRKELHEPRVHL